MNEITTTKVDVEKVRKLFDEILTYLLDNRYEQQYAQERVQIADEIFKMTHEVIELMYRTNLYFLSDCFKVEARDLIETYRLAEYYLSEIQKNTDILQS